uniref:Glycosyltransferase n=1 Tax=Neisseria meningitidis alpha522 TaxID=996307 RepID=I4E7V3_NEIME|nr:hypothetical protein NMALPHA522_1880 [Neisseria meningitidis alpha522]
MAGVFLLGRTIFEKSTAQAAALCFTRQPCLPLRRRAGCRIADLSRPRQRSQSERTRRSRLYRYGFCRHRPPPRFRSKTTRLFYLGTLSYSYDVETVCKGVRKLLDDGENVELHIMGGGPDLEKLKQYENRAIKFYGYLPYSEMMSIAKGCDIAVNAIHSHAMQSVTNKLSDYMALQKPILNSQTNAEVLSLLNLLPHENYRSGDVDSFVQAAKDILKRKNDPVQSDEIVRRFRRDISYRKIVNLIERLANE